MDNRKLVVDAGEIAFSFRISTKHWSGFPFGLGALACLATRSWQRDLGNENAADTPDGSDQQADGGLAAFAPAL
jgi:hypothetical protein